MRESYYQTKIIKAIEEMGGVVVNGRFTKRGIPDLQCGYPYNGKLYYLAVEVKTEKDYYRLMSGINRRYKVKDLKKLKPHEPLQIARIREIRKRGGLALVAYNIEQIKVYVKETLDKL